MKKTAGSFFIFLCCMQAGISQIAISNSSAIPHSSAQLDVSATNKGLLIPRMSTASRLLIAAPANGLIVYDSTTRSQWFFSHQFNIWLQMIDSTKDMWAQNNDALYNRTAGTVGIGTSNPGADLHIYGFTSPSMRFTNVSTGGLISDGGQFQLFNGELTFNNFENTRTAILTEGSERLTIRNGDGNIGIGNANPTSPLSFASSTGDKINLSNVSSTEAFGIGIAGGTMQIHTTDAGDTIQFGIGKSGNSFIKKLWIEPGPSGSNISLTNKMTRNNITGAASVLPVAIGKINADGTIANSGTGNFSVTRLSGAYRILLSDPDFATQPYLFTIIVTPSNYFNSNMPSQSITYDAAEIVVTFTRFSFSWSNFARNCAAPACADNQNFASIIDYQTNVISDCSFGFMIYKSQ